LLNYPEVLRMMNDDIDWTWKLGDAVVNQQADVIAAVESFRDRAYAAGNLKSDQHQKVSEDDGIIEIVPVNDEIIYVPYYEPEQVVVRQVTPVYYYYPRPYPVYYYPYPVGFSFYSGYFWGVTTAYRIGWATDHLHVHHHSYWGHPYFGHSYYGHYYRQPSVYVYNSWYVNNSPYYSSNRYRDGDYWRPRTHSRARPAYYSSRTRSYRDNDVNRASSSRGYGNAYTAQAVSRDSAQSSTNRNGRLSNSGERVRTEQGSSREVNTDNIRFRERSDNPQTVRQDPAAGATRSGTTTRTTARTTARTDSRSESRRLPVTAPTTTANNRPRADSRAPQQSSGATQPVQRTVQPANQRNSSRQASRVEVRTEARTEARNSTPERREVRTNSRAEARPEARQESRQEARQNSRTESRVEPRAEPRAESRQAQASVRQGNQGRRERD
jgi:hypothetical protein